MIGADEYVEFLSREYLRGYVDEGGSAVKFVVADDFVASGFRDRVADEGRQSGYVVAAVDAATTRVHLMEQIFFEVARQIDWRSAERRCRGGLSCTDGRHPDGRRTCFALQNRRPGVEARCRS
jgi:hypothetical protein